MLGELSDSDNIVLDKFIVFFRVILGLFFKK